MKHKEENSGTTGYRTLIFTWLTLLCLTGLTVWIAGVNMGRHGVAVNILIASLKAGLVLFIFMRLKHESLFFRLMLLLIVVTLTAIMALTFLDVLYR
ncbi:MAG: cytochrome C oxidase subunit IV family protein [Nitrospirota bacterium]